MSLLLMDVLGFGRLLLMDVLGFGRFWSIVIISGPYD